MRPVVLSIRIPNPYSWNTPNNHITPPPSLLPDLAEELVKPHRYARTFEAERKERPLAEMDKAALSAYIREILSGAGSESKETAE